MKTIFVCSPYSGEIEKNVKQAQEICRTIAIKGHIPIAPHLFYPQFLNDNIEPERTVGLSLGCFQLLKCDLMIVFGEVISKGMQYEIDIAKNTDIPIKYVKNVGDIINEL